MCQADKHSGRLKGARNECSSFGNVNHFACIHLACSVSRVGKGVGEKGSGKKKERGRTSFHFRNKEKGYRRAAASCMLAAGSHKTRRHPSAIPAHSEGI